MTPKIGEVYLVDLGFAGKVRPVVVSREDTDAPRALFVVVPLTSQSRESRYEVKCRACHG
jgi:mRNA interferase MazF